MKTLLRSSVCILILIVFFAGRASGEASLSPDMERIVKRGSLVVAIPAKNRYPYIMTTPQGEVAGFDIDMARDIARRLKVKIDFNRNAATFDEVIDIVARGEADMGMGDLSATLDRAKRVSFTRPYLKLNTYILADRKESAKYRNISTHEIVNRPGMVIAAEAGSSYMKFAKQEFPLASIVPHYDSDNEDAIESVLNGDVFGFFETEDFVRLLFRKQPELYLYLTDLRIENLEDAIAIAVPWQSAHLLTWLNLYLETVVSVVAVDDILKRYPVSE